jgi:hypothetical protein
MPVSNCNEGRPEDSAKYLKELGFERTIFNVEIHIDLLQCQTHAASLGVREHDELDVGRRFVVMELVLACSIGEKAGPQAVSCRTGSHRMCRKVVAGNAICAIEDPAYVSSSPPSLRTMLRSEKTVPKMSFASSSGLKAGRPGFVDTPLLRGTASKVGREDLLPVEMGRGSH